MKNKCSTVMLCFVLLFSCQKNISDFDPSQQPAVNKDKITDSLRSGLTAIINDTSVNFNVVAATLTRYTSSNEKRMDITGVSTDNSKKITLALGEQTSKGNDIAKKKYLLNPYPPDNPATPNIDESAFIQGYTGYGTLGSNGWSFGTYDELGYFIVSSCDASSTTISGSFETVLTQHNDQTKVIKINSGKIINVKYRVVN